MSLLHLLQDLGWQGKHLPQLITQPTHTITCYQAPYLLSWSPGTPLVSYLQHCTALALLHMLPLSLIYCPSLISVTRHPFSQLSTTFHMLHHPLSIDKHLFSVTRYNLQLQGTHSVSYLQCSTCYIIPYLLIRAYF